MDKQNYTFFSFENLFVYLTVVCPILFLYDKYEVGLSYEKNCNANKLTLSWNMGISSVTESLFEMLWNHMSEFRSQIMPHSTFICILNETKLPCSPNKSLEIFFITDGKRE